MQSASGRLAELNGVSVESPADSGWNGLVARSLGEAKEQKDE